LSDDEAFEKQLKSSALALERRLAPHRKPVKRRWIVRLVLLSSTFVILAALGIYAWGVSAFNAPGPAVDTVTVVLAKGSGVNAIARRLAEAGVIRRAEVFAIATRISKTGTKLKAGEFEFPPGVSAKAVMHILIRGETVVRKLTIAEGLQTPQALELILAADGLEGDLDLKGDVGLAGGVAMVEGALLPETWHYKWGDKRSGILERMRAGQKKLLAEEWTKRAQDLPFQTMAEALVLASIVEKETAKSAEREHVAGVFVNRLRRGMRLQSDPTVAYGLSPDRPLDRPLSRADLKSRHPWNTYVHKGLPPSPICLPGRAAVQAVLHPLQTRDLYFVADGTGGHVFAATLADHNRNVAKWRRLQRAIKKEP
jgi:UPF0755 protein